MPTSKEPNTKQRFQILGGSIMFVAFLPQRGEPAWQFHPKMFRLGALICASTFLTWKRKKNDDEDDLGSGSGV